MIICSFVLIQKNQKIKAALDYAIAVNVILRARGVRFRVCIYCLVVYWNISFEGDVMFFCLDTKEPKNQGCIALRKCS